MTVDPDEPENVLLQMKAKCDAREKELLRWNEENNRQNNELEDLMTAICEREQKYIGLDLSDPVNFEVAEVLTKGYREFEEKACQHISDTEALAAAFNQEAEMLEDYTAALHRETERLKQERCTGSFHVGEGLARVASFFLSKRAYQQVVAPHIADMRHEHSEAITKGEMHRARWVIVRGYVQVLWPFVYGLYTTAITILKLAK